MADKIKKISINAFENAVNSQYNPTEVIEWRELKIVVKRSLTLKDTLTFVDSVVKSCFSQEDGAYMPEIKDFAIRSCIVEHYTNITLPSNLDKRYDLLYSSNLLDAIMQNVDQLQFNAMMRAIESKTEYLAKSNIESSTRAINELYASLDSLREKFEATFANISGDELNKVITAIGANGLDEEKIVKAVLKAKKSGE